MRSKTAERKQWIFPGLGDPEVYYAARPSKSTARALWEQRPRRENIWQTSDHLIAGDVTSPRQDREIWTWNNIVKRELLNVTREDRSTGGIVIEASVDIGL